MTSIKEQFRYEKLSGFYEQDTHLGIQGLEIERLQILNGESPPEDILLVVYKRSPHLSFHDANGKLIDIDHYLPDEYHREDTASAENLLSNLYNVDVDHLKDKDQLHPLIKEIFEVGQGKLAPGLRKKFGLESGESTVRQFRETYGLNSPEFSFSNQIKGRFFSFYEFLETYIVFQQKVQNGYIHITPSDNIIITPLNKRSGVAVILETQSAQGTLLPPNQWTITRTTDEDSLEQTLVFRSADVRQFFSGEGLTEMIQTDRYKLIHTPDHIALDSLLDNTDNLLELNLVNDCFQVFPSDPNIIVALTHEQEVTVVNTHRSIIPSKWPKKIVLPEPAIWMRASENFHLLFVQNRSGDIAGLDITGDHPTEICRLENYAPGFELDQSGSLLLKIKDKNQILKVTTNLIELELPSDEKGLATVLKNLRHLFKGESLFTKTKFAKVVTEEKPVERKQYLPKAFESAKFDYETHVEHMLAEAGNDYEALLLIQQKVAIARQNIAEELTFEAEKEGITLVGQRLQSVIRSIMGPAERKVRNLVEESRANRILADTQRIYQQVDTLYDPNAYREILNTLRQYQEELNKMLPDNVAQVMTPFKRLQEELNAAFSAQIVSDGTALQNFINGEIGQVEQAIANTHDPLQLEQLLSTHPAALELMNLLKQPFVLQNIAKGEDMSPAGIQSRLYQSVAIRKRELHNEVTRQEEEKNAAKRQLATMIEESIDFFVKNHTGGFSDLELSNNAAYQSLLKDIQRLESSFKDVRMAMELRRQLERRILERNREDLEKLITFEGKYAFIQNDPDLYVDPDSSIRTFPKWTLRLVEKRGAPGSFAVHFVRNTDLAVFRPGAVDNLESNHAFELEEADYADFMTDYKRYSDEARRYEFVDALWKISHKEKEARQFPQFDKTLLDRFAPKSPLQRKALRCALEKKRREEEERTRQRNVPVIPPEFIDETPYFQQKIHEFAIKVKLQLLSGSGIILLSGPPATGKSAFLKFIAAIMNREYFEHAADKWQTKNTLITAIKFSEYGPYATPAGFTRAITTPHSLVSIEEIKEWPEALRKSLNPLFAGSHTFTAPDGTVYSVGENVLLCAAANLGSMYRQDDEPFTADFWSRIEVVEYNYAPEKVDRAYFKTLHQATDLKLLTLQDLVRYYFRQSEAPGGAEDKARYYARQFLQFILLPKADEKIKRENLRTHLDEYFEAATHPGGGGDVFETEYSPEEAAKVALRRLKDFQGYTAREFYDLYDHFINKQNLRSRRFIELQSADVEKYEQLKMQIHCIRFIEGCLRSLRQQFYSTGGQTEVEGTNREFIKSVYLLGLLGWV